jgi:hypothetical protein
MAEKEPTTKEMISAIEAHLPEYAPICGMTCPGRRMKDAIIRRIERKVSREWVEREAEYLIANEEGHPEVLALRMKDILAMLKELGYEVTE